MVKTADIKRIREKRRETQEEFAARLGVSQGTISNWENSGVPEDKKTQLFLRERLASLARQEQRA